MKNKMNYFDYTLNEVAIIVLDSIIELEYKHKKLVLSKFNEPKDILANSEKTKEIIYSLFDKPLASIINLSFSKDYFNYIVEKYEKLGTRVITYLSKDYPEELTNIDSPPLCLYCNGNIGLLSKNKKFSIVGSRKTLTDICQLTKNVSKSLSESDVVIVTGSAGGADKSAIEGAVASGNIISVLAGGLSFVYPAYNKRLIEVVEENGLVISEHQPATPSRPWMFPVRNRIIAGLSSGVLIVSGSKESGARHTANFALDYGREIFAFPYSLGISSGELPNSLIKAGANLCEGVADIFNFFGIEEKPVKKIELDEDEQMVYDLIKEGICDVDEILKKLNIQMFELAPTLSMLELDGLIVKLAGNKYKTVG